MEIWKCLRHLDQKECIWAAAQSMAVLGRSHQPKEEQLIYDYPFIPHYHPQIILFFILLI
jgi:DNA-binding PucR family transcriptional regulator